MADKKIKLVNNMPPIEEQEEFFESENTILYELLVRCEWPLEPESLKAKEDVQQVLPSDRRWFHWKRGNIDAPSLNTLRSLQLPWLFAVDQSKSVVAVLQSSSLEIRAAKDDYANIVGKCSVWEDPYPSWRQIDWNADASVVAVSFSNGLINLYDLTATFLYTIYPPKYNEAKPVTDASCAFAGLVFTDIRTANTKWSGEVIAVTFQGEIRSYLVSATHGYQERNIFSLSKHYPYGITSVTYQANQHILYIAGPTAITDIQQYKSHGSSRGITAWRLLSDFPHYKPMFSMQEEQSVLKRGASWLSLWSTPQIDPAWRLSASPCGRMMAALHLSGQLSLWSLPSLHLQRSWQLEAQVDAEASNPNFNAPGTRKKKKLFLPYSIAKYPIDVNWWTSEGVIVGRCSGAVSVYSVRTGNNLLGEFPEWLMGVPRVSVAHGDNHRGFLSIECESTLESRRRRSTVDEGYDSGESSDEEGSGIMKRSMQLGRGALYWLTDMERFQPPRKKTRVLLKTYRLLCLKSTTPEELFARKIDAEEYGEAVVLARKYGLDTDLVYQRQWRKSNASVAAIQDYLEIKRFCGYYPRLFGEFGEYGEAVVLARKYGLDTDLVYQRQWRKSNASVAAIQDYLSKIKKRSWVLHECLERVPENIDAARELLVYGLKGTNLDTLSKMSRGSDTGEFIPTPVDMLELEGDERHPCRLKSSEEKRLLMELRKHSLTLEQQHLLGFRRRLLRYLKCLHTYEIIIGGAVVAEDNYIAKRYERFRSLPPLKATLEFAREGDWKAVDAMFTYHGDSVLPHALPLLSCFPETLSPYEYCSLLPECDMENKVLTWEDELHFAPDWSETSQFKNDSSNDDEDDSWFYEELPELKEFQGAMDAATLTRWYIFRAKEMDARSYMVEQALHLIRLAKERNVQNLEALYEDLLSMETLVYDVQIEKQLSLQEYQTMSDAQRVHLLMSTSTNETCVRNMRQWLVPWLERNRSRLGDNRLLQEYLVDKAHESLVVPLRVLESGVVEDVGDRMALVIRCVYAMSDLEQLPTAFKLLSSLPERGFLGNGTDSLHDELDTVERELSASSVFGTLGHSLIPKEIHQLRDDVDKVTELFVQITRGTAKRSPPASRQDWKTLLQDIQHLQELTFDCISPADLLQIFTESLLHSGDIKTIILAGDYLTKTKDADPMAPEEKVDYETSVRQVLKAAREYFNSAASFEDMSMEYAKESLMLIGDSNEEVQVELDLIAALKILQSFGVSMLPVQVRLMENRGELIQTCLAETSKSYLRAPRLLRLASQLRVDRREGLVRVWIGEAALKDNDIKVCTQMCDELMAGPYSEGWSICAQLGQAEELKDWAIKSELLAFSLTYCPDSHINELIGVSQIIEHKKKAAQLDWFVECSDAENENMSQGDINDTNSSIDDSVNLSATEGLLGNSLEATKQALLSTTKVTKRALWSTTEALMSTTEVFRSPTQALRSTTAVTKHALSAIGGLTNPNLWKNVFSIPPSQEDNSLKSEEENTEYELEGCCAYYQDIMSTQHPSELHYRYDRYSSVEGENKKMELLISLLKLSMNDLSNNLDEAADETNIEYIDNILRSAAEIALREDVGFALSILMSIRDTKTVEECFKSVPRTEVTLQVAAYHAALRLYAEMEEQLDWPQGMVYQIEPSKLVRFMSSKSTDSYWSKMLQQYRLLLEDLIQGETLQRLGSGVDVTRFSEDSEYKVDTVLGLAMSCNDEVLKTAVSLASRYGVSVWEVYTTHLEYLLSGADVPVEEIEKRTNAIINILLEKPQQLIERLDERVYQVIPGTDYPRLGIYYSVLARCEESYPSSSLPASQHLVNIDKLKSSFSGVDYKQLAENPRSLEQILYPVLTFGNVNTLVKITRSLNCVNPESPYRILATKIFFEGDRSKKKELEEPKSERDWLRRYDTLGDWTKKIPEGEWLELASSLCFSTNAMEQVPRAARREMLKRVKRHAGQRSWNDVVKRLEAWMNHLGVIDSEIGHSLRNENNPTAPKYLREMEGSKGEEEAVNVVLMKMTANGSCHSLIRQFLALCPPELDLQLDELFTKTLRSVLSALRDGTTLEWLESKDLITVLAVIIQQIKLLMEDEPELVQEEDVMQELREFSGDHTVERKNRLALLELMEENFTLDESDQALLLVKKTEALVNVPVDEVQLETVEGRTELFKKLLKSSQSLQDLENLVQLLQVWPQKHEDLWVSLLIKMIKRSSKDEKALKITMCSVQWLQENYPLESQSILTVYESLNAHKELSCALKAALMSQHESLHLRAVQDILALKQIPSSFKEEDILKLIVKNSLTPRLVSSVLFPRLREWILVEMKEKEVEDIAKSMASAGYGPQAASLLMAARGVPKGLCTARAALYVLNSLLEQT